MENIWFVVSVYLYLCGAALGVAIALAVEPAYVRSWPQMIGITALWPISCPIAIVVTLWIMLRAMTNDEIN